MPDDGSVAGLRIDIVNIFMSFDDNLFEAIDTDASTAGIQPFTLGSNSQLSPSHVNQVAQQVNGVLSYEFIYTDQTTGLTFFDGVQTLAFANFKARSLSGGPAVTTNIQIDNQDPRRTRMLDQTITDIVAGVPAPIEVIIIPRGQVTGTVPLKGRSVSADTIDFFLREVGSFDEVFNPFFLQNDIDPDRAGAQVITTGVDGQFVLNSVPAGRFILVAKMDRHLAGHDTLDVNPGFSLTGVQLVIDGDHVDRGFLLAGDVSGFNDSTGASLPNNVINGADLNAIDQALFEQVGDSLYSAIVDVNRDGVINATDRDFAAANVTNNTGVSGIKPVFPTFKRSLLGEPDPVVRMKAPGGAVQVGDVVDVTIEAEGFVLMHTYQLRLIFDPTAFAVVDVTSRVDVFSNYNADMAGRLMDGDFGLVNSILGPGGVSGPGSLATIRLRALKNVGETELSLIDVLMIDSEHEVPGECPCV